MEGTMQTNLRTTKYGKLLLGELPKEFLRVTSNNAAQDQVSRDGQLAQQMAAQEVQQQRLMQQQSTVSSERLFISILEAKLNKNYGMVRMDPYCRVRANHGIYETDTAYNGAKNPRWSKTIAVPWTEPVDVLYVEVFDEKSLSTDSRIAWVDVPLPENVRNGEQMDEWLPLSGKLGEEAEGTIHIVMSKKKVQQRAHGMPYMFPQTGFPVPQALPVNGNPYYPGTSAYYAQPNSQQSEIAAPTFTDADIKQIKELFPDMDDEAIKTVLEASRGNKDSAINSLLSMQ